MTLTPQQKAQLMMMESKAGRITMIERYAQLKELNLPQELVTAFNDISMKTAKTIAGKTIEIGKIVIDKIIDFVKENPNMAIGVLIGAVIGALTSLIPFIGPIIAPLAAIVGAGIGGYVGHRMDKKAAGENVSNGLVGVTEDLITIAKKFFALFKDIFDAVVDKNTIK